MSDPNTGTPGGQTQGDGAATQGNGARRRRRRGSRGGRGRARTAQASTAASAANEGSTAPPADRRPDDLPDRPREGRPSGRGEEGEATADPAARSVATPPPPPFVPKVPPPRPPAPSGDGSRDSARRRRRRGGRGRGGGRGATAADDGRRTGGTASVEVDDEVFERRRGRERKGRPVGRYLMCVQVRDSATQLAVLEGRALIEHYVSRAQDDATQIDGNIYVGRIQNVLPGMEAAFVDIGTPKNAVLYRGDVRYDADDVVPAADGEAKASGGDRPGGPRHREARIEQLLRPGQTILCQVTKNPIGTKGGRLTQEVSLPGRFLVLIPNSDSYGISKRLPDEERRRLRRILDEIRPGGHGLIVRTAAEGATAEELGRDLGRLLEQWEEIDARAGRASAPALLYREPSMAVRIIREEFNSDYRGVVIDDPSVYEEVRGYVGSISPELADRVEYYDRDEDPLPLFERFHVHEQLHKALDRKVWLPSGGSLIVERTEALTVIDVNTGKNVGSSNLEETVYRNNLEAADEIARQLRLRDIGGIIVIDFIDMEDERNRVEVMRAFRDALARDKTRTQVFDISHLGLVEMTRKRVSEGLVESFSSTCPTCAGRGIVFDDGLL